MYKWIKISRSNACLISKIHITLFLKLIWLLIVTLGRKVWNILRWHSWFERSACKLKVVSSNPSRDRPTVPTGPNLTESGTKPDPGFAFGVRSGSARVDPEQTPTGPRPDTKQTHSGPRADAKRTPKANPNFRSKPVKRTPGSALRNRAVNQDYW